MRVILTVHQFLPRFSGGTEVLVLETARHLWQRGHDVHVLTAEPAGDEQAQPGCSSTDDLDGITVHRVHCGKETGADRFRNHCDNRLMHAACAELFGRLRPELVHVFHLYRLSTSVTEAARASGARVVFTATDFFTICPTSLLRRHDGSMCQGPGWGQGNCLKCLQGYAPRRLGKVINTLPAWVLGTAATIAGGCPAGGGESGQLLREFVQRRGHMQRMLRGCDALIAPTRIMADMLTRNGCPAGRVLRLGFGLNTQYTDPYQHKAPAAELRLGYIGQLAQHKGVDVLLQAFGRLTDAPGVRPVSLQIWGDPGQQPAFTAQLQKLARATSNVSFAGTFANAHIGAVLSGIDVLVVPSVWYENAPLVVLSALATRTPVIATNLPGLSELVEQDRNGLLFDLADVEDLARQLRRARDEQGLLARLRDGIAPVTTMPEHVAELEKIYLEVLRGARARQDFSRSAAS